jgi:hypothetical protein
MAARQLKDQSDDMAGGDEPLLQGRHDRSANGVMHDAGVESQHRRPIALALLGAQGGGMECGEAGEAGVELGERSLRHVGVQRAVAEAAG